MPEITMCDQPGCEKAAALSYRWDWGQTGACCQAHGSLLQQTAVNVSSHDLKRTVNLAPLAYAAEAPVERSERTQLIAAKLSAEAETAELKQRGADLYRQNVELTKTVQSITLRHREADTQLGEAARELEKMHAKLKERDAELMTVTDELQRMQTLAAFADTKATEAGKAKTTSKGG